jgi:hypothetical protein
MFRVKAHRRDLHCGVIWLHAARVKLLRGKSGEILIGLMRNRGLENYFDPQYLGKIKQLHELNYIQNYLKGVHLHIKSQNVMYLYRAFQNVLRDYRHL